MILGSEVFFSINLKAKDSRFISDLSTSRENF